MRRTAAVVVLVLVAAAGAGLWLLRPPDLRHLIPPGHRYDVRILRDTWGVPHVFGRRDPDVAYGLAWAHAEDDFATIQGALLAARGALASEYGRDAAPNDYMVGLLGVREIVAAGYPRLDEPTRAIAEAYADGLNHYAALHPGGALGRLYPVRGEDVVAGFVHKLPLFFGLDAVLRDLFADEERGQAPPPSKGPSARRARAIPGHLGPVANEVPVPVTAPRGSNAWAVGPSRTADGSTYLLVNSHQPWTGPVAWYEAHLRSEEGWEMVGSLFPGSPVILHGHNRHLGWAHTVNRPDLIDVYELAIDPEDPDRYRFDDEWHRLERRDVPIRVKLLGPLHWTFRREALGSLHGPAVRRPHGTYALAVAGLGDTLQLTQWYRMNRARDLAEFREAMRIRALPTLNTVYADRDGNVHYLYNALLPEREPGHDWDGVVPGDRSATRWTNVLPFDALPQVLNPPSGFVQSCNGTPFATTAGDGNPDPAGYLPGYRIETELTNRTRRSLELLGSDASIEWSELESYKCDTRYAPDSEMARLVARLLALPRTGDPLLARAREVLSRWDLDTGAENRQAALALLALGRYFPGLFERPSDEQAVASLLEAAATLERHFGGLEVPLGDVQRLRRGDTDLPLGGGPDVLRAVYGELQPDGRLAATAGDSYVLMARWAPDGTVDSQSIHNFGSATLDPASPHYADQSPLFAECGYKPVWLEEAEIREQLGREYRPGDFEADL